MRDIGGNSERAYFEWTENNRGGLRYLEVICADILL